VKFNGHHPTHFFFVYNVFFFFKQKTAYEIVSRDWSSDVCSSDLTMKKTFTLLAAALAVAVLGAPGSVSAETLRVGMECTYAPFTFRNADGKLDGYDVDVAKGVAGMIGADLEFVCQKWDGMIPALLANKFDLIVASMSITDKRKKKIDFSAPYRISVGRFIGKKDGKLNLFNANGAADIDNFKGVKVGLPRALSRHSQGRRHGGELQSALCRAGDHTPDRRFRRAHPGHHEPQEPLSKGRRAP